MSDTNPILGHSEAAALGHLDVAHPAGQVSGLAERHVDEAEQLHGPIVIQLPAARLRAHTA